MKIAFVIRRCAPKGPVFQTYNLAEYFSGQGHEVSLITLKQEKPGDSVIDRFEHLPIRIETVDCGVWTILCGVFGTGAPLRLIKSLGPDIVHTTGIIADFLFYRYRGKSAYRHVLTIRNYVYHDYPDLYGPLLGRLMARLHLRVIKRSEHAVTCSHSLAQLYRQHHGLRLHTVQNGVNLGQFDIARRCGRDRLRERYGWDRYRYILLTTAVMIERKNIPESIDAFLSSRRAKDSALVIAGDGPCLAELQKRYRGEEHVLFTGRVADVADRLACADLFLSSSRSEGLPNALMEAMAMGLPYVLSDIPQHREIHALDHRAGWMYPLGETQSLTQVLDAIDFEQLPMHGKAARQVVEEHLSSAAMGRQYFDWYRG